MSEKKEVSSHGTALKSVSIIGGATVIVMFIRMVRTKVLAMLLGPAGIGLEAIYDSIVNLARTLTDLGVSSSGVRQIAAAVGSGDERLIAITVLTLRRLCLLLGLAGAGTLFLLRETVSRLAFDSPDHADAIGLLSIILLWGSISGGQGALLQGVRRIGDLARMKIWGALVGAALSIPFVWLWGRDGIVAYMIVGAGIATLVSWVYARRVPVKKVEVTIREIRNEAGHLLKLGLAFVSTGLMSMGALFLLRTFVMRHQGLDGAGQFQAASALASVYAGFVLQAMGTDFYPRLTAVADDNQRCNQLVNEQTEISILLALPGVIATLAFAPWVIHLFYSGRFDQAVEILYWQAPGVFLQVNSWPIGFILLAKGRSMAFFWTDLAAYGVYVALGWLGLKYFGLPGTGMAFFALYVFHWIMIYAVARRISGFTLSAINARLSLLGMAAIGFTLWARLKLPDPWSFIVGGAFAVLVGIYCLKILIRLIGSDKLENYIRKLKLKNVLSFLR